jgi:hypothetical protein
MFLVTQGFLSKRLVTQGYGLEAHATPATAAGRGHYVKRQPRTYRHDVTIEFELATEFAIRFEQDKRPEAEEARPWPRTFSHEAISVLKIEISASVAVEKNQPLEMTLDLGRQIEKRFRKAATPQQRQDDELAALVLFLLDS